MLDFDKLDEALEAAVGIAPPALLGSASSPLSSRFLLARERLSELCDPSDAPGTAEILERDRLASFFGCAYGDNGFLARAGTLHTLAERLGQVSQAIPRLVEEPGALTQLRRELAILRALARHRLSRPLHDDDRPLLARLAAAEDALAGLAEWVLTLRQGGRELSTALGSGRLYGLADLVNVASDFREGLSLPGLLSFVLGRLADHGFTRDSRSALDERFEAEAASLRAALWALAESGYARRERPPTLAELRELDVALELLRSELSSSRRSAAARAQTVTALHALLALGPVEEAARLASRLLDGAFLLLAEGLAAEAKHP